MESVQLDQSQENLSGYITQYKGVARYTRLLKLADQDDIKDARTSTEAIRLCLLLAKSEN
jgi:hypothetical protein